MTFHRMELNPHKGVHVGLTFLHAILDFRDPSCIRIEMVANPDNHTSATLVWRKARFKHVLPYFDRPWIFDIGSFSGRTESYDDVRSFVQRRADDVQMALM
jgi:hypothetical protein